MDTDITQFDPIAEINRYFDDSSLPTSQSPQAVIIAGGVAQPFAVRSVPPVTWCLMPQRYC
jgi:hypothetical protein